MIAYVLATEHCIIGIWPSAERYISAGMRLYHQRVTVYLQSPRVVCNTGAQTSTQAPATLAVAVLMAHRV